MGNREYYDRWAELIEKRDNLLSKQRSGGQVEGQAEGFDDDAERDRITRLWMNGHIDDAKREQMLADLKRRRDQIASEAPNSYAARLRLLQEQLSGPNPMDPKEYQRQLAALKKEESLAAVSAGPAATASADQAPNQQVVRSYRLGYPSRPQAESGQHAKAHHPLYRHPTPERSVDTPQKDPTLDIPLRYDRALTKFTADYLPGATCIAVTSKKGTTVTYRLPGGLATLPGKTEPGEDKTPQNCANVLQKAWKAMNETWKAMNAKNKRYTIRIYGANIGVRVDEKTGDALVTIKISG